MSWNKNDFDFPFRIPDLWEISLHDIIHGDVTSDLYG